MAFLKEQIDRAIYEAIRLNLVAEGHLPDVMAISDVPTFNSAKKAIADSKKGVLIELLSQGDYIAKGELNSNTIIIQRRGEDIGDARSSGAVEFSYQAAKGNFEKKTLPTSNFNLPYDITIVTKTTHHERLIDRIIQKSLPRKGTMKGRLEDGTETQETFRIEFENAVIIPTDKWIEIQMSYLVRNVYLEEAQMVEEVPVMEEIIFGTNAETPQSQRENEGKLPEKSVGDIESDSSFIDLELTINP